MNKRLWIFPILVIFSMIVKISWHALPFSDTKSTATTNQQVSSPRYSDSLPQEEMATETTPAIVEAKRLDKFNAYVEFSNALSNMNVQLEKYVDEFGKNRQPRIDNHFSFTFASISDNDLDNLKVGFAYAHATPAYQSVDATIEQMQPVVNNLTSVINKAHTYYETKGYLDDQFAKCKQYHSELIQSIEVYEELSRSYFKEFKKVENEFHSLQLQKFKDAGSNAPYYALKFLMDVESLSDELSKQGITAQNMLALNMATFKPKYDQVAEDLDHLLMLVDKPEEARKAGYDPYSLKRYADTAKDVKIAAASLIERVNKKKAVESYVLESKFFTKQEKGMPENYKMKVKDAVVAYNLLLRK
ncbi:DUF3829 domain-containing protein [Brevibacillus ginsengisoli]|uniref:DUF3829 domain-containing protein n=1 Tax=Brevibacillus ginsengisoli TaxID=363854 RepID=UPI003CFA4850